MTQTGTDLEVQRYIAERKTGCDCLACKIIKQTEQDTAKRIFKDIDIMFRENERDIKQHYDNPESNLSEIDLDKICVKRYIVIKRKYYK